jgi:hypothetical protein
MTTSTPTPNPCRQCGKTPNCVQQITGRWRCGCDCGAPGKWADYSATAIEQWDSANPVAVPAPVPTPVATCRDIAIGLGADQAQAMGIPLTDEPFADWQARRPRKTMREVLDEIRRLTNGAWDDADPVATSDEAADARATACVNAMQNEPDPAAAMAELARLRAALPRTADGVVVVPGMVVYRVRPEIDVEEYRITGFESRFPHTWTVFFGGGCSGLWDWHKTYATRAAAEAARGGGE